MMAKFTCGWCRHSGVHATTIARGSRPTRCTGCAECQREQQNTPQK
jgi:hypothetical protein